MYQLDPKIALFTAMTTAKVCYQLQHGKLKSKRIVERELYPELEEEA